MNVMTEFKGKSAFMRKLEYFKDSENRSLELIFRNPQQDSNCTDVIKDVLGDSVTVKKEKICLRTQGGSKVRCPENHNGVELNPGKGVVIRTVRFFMQHPVKFAAKVFLNTTQIVMTAERMKTVTL